MTNDILDAVIVGGGPAGTAAAFRAKELGLRAQVIDFDDILKRIRDYPKDKLILPDFGGGDRMAFPAGDALVTALQFQPIDKDDIWKHWKELYTRFGVPARTGIELTAMERVDDVWNITTWDHKNAEAAIFRARHVVLALGRGVPRRFDIPGNTDGIAYRLDDPARYVSGPVLVVGGGTSAAEAVLAISRVKNEAEDNCGVYWAYRGTKMPRVSKALAEAFFEAYIGNGNIRSCPDSEPVAVVTGEDRTEMLALKIDRKTLEGRPPETMHLEFHKSNCIACIGEDIPEALLNTVGVSMVVNSAGKKMMAVTSLLETQQPNVYMIGDLLSQSYLETDDFNAPVDDYRQVKHRGNIKTSLRDGVFVAEVIKQRIDGKQHVNVVIRDAEPVAALDEKEAVVKSITSVGAVDPLAAPGVDPTAPDSGYLVLITPAGIEGEEYRIKSEGLTTIGRIGTDIAFTQDTSLSDAHASLSFRDGSYYLRDDGSRSGTYLRIRPENAVRVRDGDLIRAGRQILLISHNVRGNVPQIDHYDASGQHVASYQLATTLVFGRTGGRSNPDVILDDRDPTLSRFHLSLTFENDEIKLQDFGSKNGTFLKVDAERKLDHRDMIRVGGQQLEFRMREDLPEKTSSAPVEVIVESQEDPLAVPPPPAAPEPESVTVTTTAMQDMPSLAAAPAGAHVTFNPQGLSGEIDAAQTLLAWADEKEVSIDYECWIGMCGCDAIRIISGAENLNEVTEKEIKTLKRKGLEPGPCRLACMTKTSGPVVVEVIQ